MICPFWWLESGPMREFLHSRQEFNGMLIVFGLRAGYTGNNIVSEVRGDRTGSPFCPEGGIE